MVKLLKILGLIFGFFFQTMALADTQQDWAKIILRIGETRDLAIDKVKKIHVTQRQIVEISLLDDHWMRITALKKGLTYIVEKDAAMREKKRTLIEVLAEPQKSSIDSPHIVDKSYSRALDFMSERELCHKKADCFFRAKLSSSAQQELALHWQKRLGPLWKVEVFEDGLGLVMAACQKHQFEDKRRELRSLVGSALDSGLVHFRCMNESWDQRFILKSYMVGVHDSELEKFGTEFDAKLPIWGRKAENMWDFNAFMSTFGQKMLASPMLRLKSGVEASLKSGTEVLINKDSRQHKGMWKQVGLELKARVEPEELNLVSLDYEARLSHMGHSELQGISFSAIKSSVVLKLGVGRLIGQAESSLNKGAKNRFKFLGSTPILGPFFRLFIDSKELQKIFIWVCLERDDRDTEGLGEHFRPASR